MSNNNKNNTSSKLSAGLVPKLRFPEFKDDKAWEVDEVGNVFEVTRGYVLSMNLVSKEQSESNPFPVYSSQTKNNGLAGYYKEFLYEDAITWTTDGANAGDVKFRKGKFYCTNVCGVLINKNGFANLCIASLIDSVSRKYVSYVGNPKLMNGVMSKIKIPFPKIDEQQKIAACLSSLDEVITAEQQKLEELKQHKKGLLQNLFPQEGETTPKLRFPEFKDSGEWEEKLIEDYFTVCSSKRVLQQDWTNQGVPFYRTRELVSLSKNEPFGSEVFISEELFSEIQKKYGIPKEGDFLVSGVGTLGICYQVQSKDRFYFKDGNVLWFKLENGLNSTYFKFCFQSEHIQNQIIGQISKSTVGTYTIQNAKKNKFWYPPTIKEQEIIANTLSSIDELIDAQSKKIELLQQHKKGLLQGLFPDIKNYENG